MIPSREPRNPGGQLMICLGCSNKSSRGHGVSENIEQVLGNFSEIHQLNGVLGKRLTDWLGKTFNSISYVHMSLDVGWNISIFNDEV